MQQCFVGLRALAELPACEPVLRLGFLALTADHSLVLMVWSRTRRGRLVGLLAEDNEAVVVVVVPLEDLRRSQGVDLGADRVVDPELAEDDVVDGGSGREVVWTGDDDVTDDVLGGLGSIAVRHWDELGFKVAHGGFIEE